MLSILFKAILLYTLFCIAKGIYNAYQLSKKIKSSRKPPPQNTFEAQFRHLEDDE